MGKKSITFVNKKKSKQSGGKNGKEEVQLEIVKQISPPENPDHLNKKHEESESEDEVDSDEDNEDDEENEEDSLSDEGEFEEEEGDEGDEGEVNNRDGLANTIANLLKQDTGSKIPVLAGRKTTIMKQLQAHENEVKTIAKKRLEKRQHLETKLISPQEVNVELEKQLRKLATKGVVALFNAVAKAKKEAAAVEDAKASAKEERVEKKALFLAPSRAETNTKESRNEKKRKLAQRQLEKDTDNQHSEKGNDSTSNKKSKWSVVNDDVATDELMGWDEME